MANGRLLVRLRPVGCGLHRFRLFPSAPPDSGFGTVVQESALGKVIDWVRYPRESNPWERLTQFTTTLQSVTFAADGERGWAVGAGGAIVATANVSTPE